MIKINREGISEMKEKEVLKNLIKTVKRLSNNFDSKDPIFHDLKSIEYFIEGKIFN